MGEDIEKKWCNIENITYKAANEDLRKRSRKKRTKNLKIWNEDIVIAIDEKQNTYQIFLQRKCDRT